MMYAGLVFFAEAMYRRVAAITGERHRWVSLSRANLDALGDAIFRLPPRYDMPVVISLPSWSACYRRVVVVLDRRVRGVEVVT